MEPIPSPWQTRPNSSHSSLPSEPEKPAATTSTTKLNTPAADGDDGEAPPPTVGPESVPPPAQSRGFLFKEYIGGFRLSHAWFLLCTLGESAVTRLYIANSTDPENSDHCSLDMRISGLSLPDRN
jgi:hypothetical protein